MNRTNPQHSLHSSPLKKQTQSQDLLFRSIKEYKDEPIDIDLKKRLDQLIDEQMAKMKDNE